MASVYRKTQKGVAEIETRANRLPPRLRTGLIMVDGRRTDTELYALIGSSGDEVLTTLLNDGYIEVIETVTVRTPPPPAAAPASAPAAANSSGGWEERRRQAVRFLNDHLGPSGESLVLKMEKARSWDELKPHLEMGEHFVRAARGASAAQEFAAKFLEQPG